MSDGKHPMQPVVKSENGVIRFKQNAIVEFLRTTHPSVDMNVLANLSFSDEDGQQFAQLIGYSVDGYLNLSYVDDDAAQRAYAEEFELKRDYCETLLKACYKLMEYENEGAEHVFEILGEVANEN